MTDYREGEVIPVPLEQWLQADRRWITSPGSYMVLCPTCGSANSRCNGASLTEDRPSGWVGDGTATRITFTCDKGHGWRLCFGVDREQTWCWTEGAPPGSSGGPSQPDDDTNPRLGLDSCEDDDEGYP